MCKAVISTIIALFILHLFPVSPSACSTFKFQKEGELIYAHNLDQPNRDMPGMIFINKRGVFKTGRSFSEMFFDDARREPTDFAWISRYGSITFSIYGRDFPDGGINEAGIFIWEMSMVGTQYPDDEKLPRLLKMNWMQFVLDNFGTLDDALTAANDIQLTGWQWHYFLGDAYGNCATIEFIDGQVVIHRGDKLPWPVLFNRPYDEEMEYAQLYKDFGGPYDVDFNAGRDSMVPRFVRAAAMLRDYEPAKGEPIEYCKSLLWQVGNKPYKWGIMVDVRGGQIYFNTEMNPEWKTFSYRDIDYSNARPFLMLNIDQAKGGDVRDRFHPVRDDESRAVFKGYVDDLPDGSMEYYGISPETMIDRFASAYHRAEKKDGQYFAGVWKGQTREKEEGEETEYLSLKLKTDGANVRGSIEYKGGTYPLQFIRLIGTELSFAFRDADNKVRYPVGHIHGSSMDLKVRWINGPLGDFVLQRQ